MVIRRLVGNQEAYNSPIIHGKNSVKVPQRNHSSSTVSHSFGHINKSILSGLASVHNTVGEVLPNINTNEKVEFMLNINLYEQTRSKIKIRIISLGDFKLNEATIEKFIIFWL